MPLVTGLTKRLEVPHEEGAWIIIRQLGWHKKDEAKRKRAREGLETIKAMGSEVLREIQDAENSPDVQAALARPAATYDQATILRFGIVQWSYDEAVTPNLIDDLDEETAAWAFQEIIAYSSPPPEDERKNGPSPST